MSTLLAHLEQIMKDTLADQQRLASQMVDEPRKPAQPRKRGVLEAMLAKGMTGYKRPSLTETYRHFFGRDFDGAHDAMADVRACRDVYFALLDGAQAAEVAA